LLWAQGARRLTPWKLAPLKGVPPDTAYIGLAYALRGDQREAHYVTSCSQVFDMDGGGMQFVAFEARDPVTDVAEARRNPFLSRDDMRAVLARSLELYQGRNGGNLPKRMVIHKTRAFKEEEIAGAFDALTGVAEIECVEINTSASWRGVWLIKSGRQSPPSWPSGYWPAAYGAAHRGRTDNSIRLRANMPRFTACIRRGVHRSPSLRTSYRCSVSQAAKVQLAVISP